MSDRRVALRRRLAVARRLLGSLRREKTIVLAILTQLFVAAFSSFLLVGLVTFYSPAAGAGAITVDVGVAGNASPSLAPVVAEGPTRSVQQFENRSTALDAFDGGELDAIMVGTRHPSGSVQVDIVVPEGEVRTTIIVVELREALAAYERDRRDTLSHRLGRQPLSVPEGPAGNPYFGFTYTVLVPLLVVLPVFISGSIVTDALTEELERGTFELLCVTPLSAAGAVDGIAAAATALAPVQTALWLLLLGANGIPIADPVGLLVQTSGLALVAVAAGAGTALLVRERRTGQLLYSFGILGAFAVAGIPAENPVNAIAKLAVGSPTPTTGWVLLGTLLVGLALYAGVRRLGARALNAG